MFWKRQTIPTERLAQDYAAAVSEFSEMLLKHVCSLDAEESSTTVQHRRQETCAVVWATSVAAFERSRLSRSDKDKLVPLILKFLLPNWIGYFPSKAKMVGFLSARPSEYLDLGDPSDPIETATALIAELSDAIQASEHTALGFRLILAPLLAKHIIADAQFLDEIKSKYALA